MSREWPSGWEDPEDVELEAEELDAETDVRQAEVAAFLAAVPAPVLPGAIESRIVAALAAESAARAEDSPVRAADSPAPAPVPDGSRILRPRPARARVRRLDRGRRFDRIRPAMVVGPLVACLLFAGLGYAISNSPSSSSSSSAASAPQAASSAAASAEGRPQYSSDSTGRSAAGSVASTPRFALTRSGTDYREATLAGQVRAVIAANEKKTPTVPSPGTPSNSSAASASSSASAPGSLSALSPGLNGCVLHFTGGAAPLLIDRASYQGTPAYVIATASHVWVVGLDCTKARPHLIASASLAS